jgi:hypothetical protein
MLAWLYWCRGNAPLLLVVSLLSVLLLSSRSKGGKLNWVHELARYCMLIVYRCPWWKTFAWNWMNVDLEAYNKPLLNDSGLCRTTSIVP